MNWLQILKLVAWIVHVLLTATPAPGQKPPPDVPTA